MFFVYILSLSMIYIVLVLFYLYYLQSILCAFFVNISMYHFLSLYHSYNLYYSYYPYAYHVMHALPKTFPDPRHTNELYAARLLLKKPALLKIQQDRFYLIPVRRIKHSLKQQLHQEFHSALSRCLNGIL